MSQAMVERSGVFLGECGCCHGSFCYTVEDKRIPADDLPQGVKVRTVLTGRCPLCDAQLKMPVNCD